MHPLRLILLVVLLYILFRLLFGAGKKRVRPASRFSADGKLPAHDVLVEDPVRHTYVPKGRAVKLARKGKTHYFCSERCRSTFLADKGETP